MSKRDERCWSSCDWSQVGRRIFFRIVPYFIYVTILISAIGCQLSDQSSSYQSNTFFRELSPEQSGIQFRNVLHESDTNNPLFFEYYYNGAGLAVGDMNNDGLSDIFFAANMEKCALYLNKGNLEFKEITETSGISTKGSWVTGVNLVDVNQDGWLDIYLCVGGNLNDSYRNLLYVSNGDPEKLYFYEQAEAAGLDDHGYSTQAAFFDYDLDGDLDLYLVTSAMNVPHKNRVKRPVGDGSHITTDRLYRNEGIRQSTQLPFFKDVSREAGIVWDGFGLGIGISDFNLDGWPDVYVCNDYISNDVLYINEGNGSFREDIRNYFKHVSYSTMGMDVSDVNNDGLVDVFTLDMLPEDYFRKRIMAGNLRSFERYQEELKSGYLRQYIRNMLQLNNGIMDGKVSFSEIGQLSGISETDWSWAPLIADFDNDGYKDLFISNGIPHDLTNMDYSVLWQNTIRKNPSIEFSTLRFILMKDLQKRGNVKKPNVIFRNLGGLHFDNKTVEWGFDKPNYSTSAVFSDLDNDGDLDLIVNNLNDPSIVYENCLYNLNQRDSAHYLQLVLVGAEGNRSGLGAKISIYSNGRMQYHEHHIARGFQSTVDRKIHFGLGSDRTIDSLIIQWPDGQKQIILDITANRELVINYKDASESVNQEVRKRNKDGYLFEEVSEKVGIEYSHREKPFVDFNIQPLIPHLYSKEGPGIAVGDVNGDGRDDFFVGGSTGFSGGFFIQDPGGWFNFSPLEDNPNYEDMGALFFDADNDGDEDLLIVSGGTGLPPGNPFHANRFYQNDGNGQFHRVDSVLPKELVCGSQVTASDFDRDGDLDLFICGRVDLENYPLPPRSYLLRNESSGSKIRFTDVTESRCPEMTSPGLVTSALWSDFDRDGWTDLMVCGDWMPVRLFKNIDGKFDEITESSGLEAFSGWWNSLVSSDFDKDGDPDYIVGNFGLNNRFKVSRDEPMQIFAKDFDNNGSIDPVCGYYVNGIQYPIHNRQQVLSQIPGLYSEFPTFEAYASAHLSDVLPPSTREDAYIAECNYFNSAYIENKGNGTFAVRSLPIETQFAPVFGMVSGDFNGDGNCDVLLAGNSYSMPVEDGQQDAFTGLLLEGDGKGHFKAILSRESGFFVDGDAKGMAHLYSENGDHLILVAQNSGDLKVFKNERKGQKLYKLDKDDAFAELYYSDGTIEFREFFYGIGYLSNPSRILEIPDNVIAVSLTNYRGEKKQLSLGK